MVGPNTEHLMGSYCLTAADMAGDEAAASPSLHS